MTYMVHVYTYSTCMYTCTPHTYIYICGTYIHVPHDMYIVHTYMSCMYNIYICGHICTMYV